jgi:formylglycine-generating enzyme required for sulfatase activity
MRAVIDPRFALTLGIALLGGAGCRRQAAGGPCPEGMAPVPGMPACIDRWEAAIEGGRAVARAAGLPAAETSWLQADAACRAAGKRLCREEEWDRACRGREERRFPYGAGFDPARCNGAERHADPGAAGVAPSGSLPGCVNPEGVFDLSGNVWEWTSATGGTDDVRVLRGGGWGNGEEHLGCVSEDKLVQPADEAHSSYGFRCCRDAGRE